MGMQIVTFTFNGDNKERIIFGSKPTQRIIKNFRDTYVTTTYVPCMYVCMLYVCTYKSEYLT
jgi:hypothetical protein